MRYAENGNLAQLSEDAGAARAATRNGVLFAGGKIGAAWRSHILTRNAVSAISTVPSTVVSGRIHVTRIDRMLRKTRCRFEWLGAARQGWSSIVGRPRISRAKRMARCRW